MQLHISILCFLAINVLNGQEYLTLDTKYEQFGTEILIRAFVENNTSDTLDLGLTMDLNSVDFSGNMIKGQQNLAFTINPGVQRNINLKTIEYSVLSESTSVLNLYQHGSLVAKDTFHLNFPNKFKNVKNKDVEIDLGGLKIDRTRTPIGREFYEGFEKRWVSPLNAGDYTIEFEELPFRFRTTILKVYLDNEKILETYLRDDEDFINQFINYAIATIKQSLVARQNRTDELGGNYNGI